MQVRKFFQRINSLSRFTDQVKNNLITFSLVTIWVSSFKIYSESSARDHIIVYLEKFWQLESGVNFGRGNRSAFLLSAPRLNKSLQNPRANILNIANFICWLWQRFDQLKLISLLQQGSMAG